MSVTSEFAMWPLIVIGLATAFYWLYTWNYSYWEKRGVPSIKATFPFGSLKDSLLGRASHIDVVNKMYKELDGHSFGGYYSNRTPVLFLRDPDLIRKVMITDFNSFHDNKSFTNEKLDSLFARNPFVLKGDRWKKTRSILSPAFSSSKVRLVTPLMREVTEQLKVFLEREAPLARPNGINVKEMAGKFTTDVVSSCGFGVSCNSLHDPEAEMRKMGRRLLEPTLFGFLKFMLRLFFPLLADLLRIRFFPLEVVNYYSRIVDEAVTYREKNNFHRNDYLQMLMELKHKSDAAGPNNPDKYTQLDVTAHMIAFITEGFETSAVTMTNVLYELAMNPEVQQRLREDLEATLQKHDGTFSYDVVHDTPYIDMVLSESLRLHPTVAFMEKVCTKPYTLTTNSGKSFDLEKGTGVTVPILAIQTDETYFPEPLTFDPERFSPDNKGSGVKDAFFPFGMGPRMCIGMRFAQAQVKMGVASIILNFEVKKTPRTVTKVEMDPKSFLYALKGGVWLDFVPIKNEL